MSEPDEHSTIYDKAWLIERPDGDMTPLYLTLGPAGTGEWQDDVDEAFRLSRQQDALDFLEYSGISNFADVTVREHVWSD